MLINIAEIERGQGRLAEARANCDKAIAIREAVISEFPEVLGYRVRLGECMLRSGQVQNDAGDLPGAVAAWRQAIRCYEDLPARGGELAMFEAGCHAQLSRVAGMNGSGISAALGRSEADKAMTILRRSVAAGDHAPELKTDSALEPLRGRPDFELLLLDVAFPAQPLAR